jgi:hypothetical protein
MMSKVREPPAGTGLPFAATLKQLADEAAARRQMEAERAREAERLERLEIRRAKQKAMALKRKQARDAKQLADQQRRERMAEVARIRRETQAAERAELERIRAESERAEQERMRLLRLTNICAETYRTLALAAWDGQTTVIADIAALDFSEELAARGLSMSRSTALADRMNETLASLRRALDRFPGRSADLQPADGVSKMGKLIDRIQPEGALAQSEALSAKSGQLCQSLEREVARLRGQEETVKDKAEQLKASAARVKSSIGVAQASEGQLVWKKAQLQPIANRLEAHLGGISAFYRARLSAGQVSVEDRAIALRQAYLAYVPDFDASEFSNLDVINIARLANDQPLIESLDPNGTRSLESEQLFRLDQLRTQLAKLTEQRKSLRRMARQFAVRRTQAQGSLSRARALQKRVVNFKRVVATPLEGVTVGQLFLEQGRWVGPVQACLTPHPPIGDANLLAAYEELRWLASDEGREFATYLDIVLAEAAKEGVRSVALTFIEGDASNRVEACGVALVCKLGWPLLHLVFSQRGLRVGAPATDDNKTVLLIGW